MSPVLRAEGRDGPERFGAIKFSRPHLPAGRADPEEGVDWGMVERTVDAEDEAPLEDCGP